MSVKRQVLLFELKNGKCPVEDFILTCEPKEQQKIVWGLKLIEDGFPFKEPHFKKIVGVDKLWELRTTFSEKSFRIFFFEAESNLIVLTSGFNKKSQKTPMKEIELAVKYMNEFLEEK